MCVCGIMFGREFANCCICAGGGGAKDHPAINVLAHSSVSNQDRVTRAGEEQKNMDDDSGRKDFPSRTWKSKGDNDLPH